MELAPCILIASRCDKIPEYVKAMERIDRIFDHLSHQRTYRVINDRVVRVKAEESQEKHN
jgi:hypothetical protein